MQINSNKKKNTVDNILLYLDIKGVSKYEFHKKNGFSNGFLDKKRAIGTDKCAKILENYPDINPNWLITGKGEMLRELSAGKGQELTTHYQPKVPDIPQQYQKIPIFDIYASAGIAQTLAEFKNLEPVDFAYLNFIGPVDGGLFVAGDSMHSLIKSGDICYYKEVAVESIVFGNIYILDFVNNQGDYHLTIKYIKKSEKPNHIKLVSYNKHHSDMDIPLTFIKNVALVKASFCKHSF